MKTNHLHVQFAGLSLKSPIIAGSSGITSSLENLKELEANGAGAVILKSVFEEQIRLETQRTLEAGELVSSEEEEYIHTYMRAHELNKTIALVKEAKDALNIPVIASISCIRDGEWVDFARKLEAAGADALELNAFVLPLDDFTESAEIERIYFDVVKHIRQEVQIPLIVKIGRFFTNLPSFVDKLKAYGANAVTLFNRFYEPDIDIEQMTLKAAPVFSLPTDLRTSLRWTGILAGKHPDLQISASTGVYSGEAAIKMILAGATTVQVCSVLYESGLSVIREMNRFLSLWMQDKGFTSVGQFRGKLSYADMASAARYERVQFLKYFGEHKIG